MAAAFPFSAHDSDLLLPQGAAGAELSGAAGGRTHQQDEGAELVYFADRYHLRKFGRPITNDEYFAMAILRYDPQAVSA